MKKDCFGQLERMIGIFGKQEKVVVAEKIVVEIRLLQPSRYRFNRGGA